MNVNGFVLEPKRTSTPFDGTVCARTNAHELVQFGLSLFQFMLKREMLKSAEFSPFVDPFVSLVIDSLRSQHIKVLTVLQTFFNYNLYSLFLIL